MMSGMSGTVIVVGSANVDLVVDVPRHPGPGETVLGGNLRRTPGGKGANQAVAAARAGGADTWFLGALGQDEHADLLVESLTGAGVRTDLVARYDDPTGVALISVTADGENSIIVAPGANSRVAVVGGLPDADVVLAQLEIPLEAIVAAARARRDGAIFVLNAAPSRELPRELYDEVDVLVVNEHEAADLAGQTDVAGRAGAGPDVRTLAAALLDRVPAVVVTLGADGVVVARRGADPVAVPAPRVDAVDTTGAGDAFCGVLAARLAVGADLVDAARAATAAGAITATRPGAQAAVPTTDEVAVLAERTA